MIQFITKTGLKGGGNRSVIYYVLTQGRIGNSPLLPNYQKSSLWRVRVNAWFCTIRFLIQSSLLYFCIGITIPNFQSKSLRILIQCYYSREDSQRQERYLFTVSNFYWFENILHQIWLCKTQSNQKYYIAITDYQWFKEKLRSDSQQHGKLVSNRTFFTFLYQSVAYLDWLCQQGDSALPLRSASGNSWESEEMWWWCPWVMWSTVFAEPGSFWAWKQILLYPRIHQIRTPILDNRYDVLKRTIFWLWF